MQWEQQPRESEQAYAAFLIFRDLKKGERSNPKVAQECAKSLSLIKRWSGDWFWRPRVAAWDEHAQGEADAARIEAIRQMNARHAANGIAMENKAMERLLALDVADLTPEQLIRLMESGIAMERAAMGADGVGFNLSLQNGGTGASICKLFVGIDLEKFATAHVGADNALDPKEANL